MNILKQMQTTQSTTRVISRADRKQRIRKRKPLTEHNVSIPHSTPVRDRSKKTPTRKRRRIISTSPRDLLSQCSELMGQTIQPEQILSREIEKNKILEILKKHLQLRKGTSILLTGKPGTGKTLLVNHILTHITDWEKDEGISSKKLIINCMDLNTPSQLYKRIVDDLFKNHDCTSQKEYISFLEEKFSNQMDKMFIIVLDEMERLLNRVQSVLKKVFQWCSDENSKVIILGIANTCDLAERFIPILQKSGHDPHTIGFPAYSKAQLFDIIYDRVKRANAENVFDVTAIKFISQKIEQMGDARAALAIAKKAIDYALESNIDKITIPIVFKVFEDSCDENSTIQMMRSLPLHQQIMLCACCKLGKQEENQQYTLNQLVDYYKQIVDGMYIPSLNRGEIIDACKSLAIHSMIAIVKGKKEVVVVNVNEEDVKFALQNEPFFKIIFNSL